MTTMAAQIDERLFDWYAAHPEVVARYPSLRLHHTFEKAFVERNQYYKVSRIEGVSHALPEILRAGLLMGVWSHLAASTDHAILRHDIRRTVVSVMLIRTGKGETNITVTHDGTDDGEYHAIMEAAERFDHVHGTPPLFADIEVGGDQ
jgi:hypothetical protein